MPDKKKKQGLMDRIATKIADNFPSNIDEAMGSMQDLWDGRKLTNKQLTQANRVPDKVDAIAQRLKGIFGNSKVKIRME